MEGEAMKQRKVNREEYNFDDTIRDSARSRQEGYCASCTPKRKLAAKGGIGHHVIPVQTLNYTEADETKPVFQNAGFFIKSLDNCVMLCGDCHFHYHEFGNTSNGAVAVPETFTHSHGVRSDLHNVWTEKVDTVWRLLYPTLSNFTKQQVI